MYTTHTEFAIALQNRGDYLATSAYLILNLSLSNFLYKLRLRDYIIDDNFPFKLARSSFKILLTKLQNLLDKSYLANCNTCNMLRISDNFTVLYYWVIPKAF